MRIWVAFNWFFILIPLKIHPILLFLLHFTALYQKTSFHFILAKVCACFCSSSWFEVYINANEYSFEYLFGAVKCDFSMKMKCDTTKQKWKKQKQQQQKTNSKYYVLNPLATTTTAAAAAAAVWQRGKTWQQRRTKNN